MKMFLIILNVILAGAAVFGTVENIRRTMAKNASEDLKVKKKRSQSGKAAAKTDKQEVRQQASTEEMIKKITENNLFYSGRSQCRCGSLWRDLPGAGQVPGHPG